MEACNNGLDRPGLKQYQHTVDHGIHMPVAVDDIHIIRDGDAYRLLHGQLRLLSALGLQHEIFVEVRGEGRVRVVRTPCGYFGGPDWEALPLLLS